MEKKPRILITNDDGIHAKGLWHLWSALAGFADLYIVAPSLDQSGTGVGITIRTPLQMEAVSWEKQTPAWKVQGTPADCVKMALSVILDKPPDLIVSGINRGSNSGRTVLYSGTVGGVIEGVLRQIPGIAFSCDCFENPPFHLAEKHIAPVVKHSLEHPLNVGTFLNVNFPKSDVKGFRMARQGRGYWINNPHERRHPEGSLYYWLGGKWHAQDEQEDSDVTLLEKNYMTAVPIHIAELTDKHTLEHRRERFEKLFNHP
jgi:5'-nucleotidase